MKRHSLHSAARERHSGDPAYPVWVTDVLHPELARTSPGEFNLAELEPWRPRAGSQRTLRTGNWIYQQLKRADLIDRCLGLRELREIKQHGIPYYRRRFGSQTVFGWKSVVRDRLGFLYVPYLFEFGDGVDVHWYLLEFAWERTTIWMFPRWAKSDPKARPCLV